MHCGLLQRGVVHRWFEHVWVDGVSQSEHLGLLEGGLGGRGGVGRGWVVMDVLGVCGVEGKG